MPRKRDRFFESVGVSRSKIPATEKTSVRLSGEPSTHTPTATSPAISVASGNETTTPSTTVPNVTSTTQHLTAHTQSPLNPKPGGASETSKLLPASSAATAAAVKGAAHTQVENDGIQDIQSIPALAAARDTQAQPLWNRAIDSDELSSQERERLTGISIGVDCQKIASDIRSMTDGILNEKRGLWKVKLRGEEVVLREVGMKILRWVDKFKQIGDIIVQYDPGHAALPWAAFRFLLQACLNKQENVDAILVGLEKTACLIGRCTIYEHLYVNENSAASKNLEKSILRLYTAILKFLAKAIRMLDGECPRIRLYCC